MQISLSFTETIMSYAYNTMVGPGHMQRPMYHGPGFGGNNPAMRMNMAGPGQHRMTGMNQGRGGMPGMPTYRGFGGMRMNTPNQLRGRMIAGHRMGMPNYGYSSRELFKAAKIEKNPKWKTELCRGVAAKFPNKSILFEKYVFGFKSIYFGPISVHLCHFHRCFGNTDLHINSHALYMYSVLTFWTEMR